MNESIPVTLDFIACKYISDLYREMRTRMEWDDDYGENLSALWDILWGMPYKGDDFTIIRPLHFRNIPHGQDQPFTEYVDNICAIFCQGLDIRQKWSDTNWAIREIPF